MSDLISRQALLESIERISVKGNVLDDDWIYRFIQEFPSAQAERKTGRWIPLNDQIAKCSSCGAMESTFGKDRTGHALIHKAIKHYCPNCGAKMDEEVQP